MPKLLTYKAIWIFTIFGTDIFENRKHVHVGRKGTEKLSKIWLEPVVEMAKAGELSISEQREFCGLQRYIKKSCFSNGSNF